jgi:cadmium resistance protein CadD (predicted permease)
VLGLAVLSLAFVGPKTLWGYLGLIPLATGLIGWCPLYTVLRINTCRTKHG